MNKFALKITIFFSLSSFLPRLILKKRRNVLAVFYSLKTIVKEGQSQRVKESKRDRVKESKSQRGTESKSQRVKEGQSQRVKEGQSQSQRVKEGQSQRVKESKRDRQYLVSTDILTTPGESTKIRGVRVDESSTTDAMSSTGGSTNLNIKKKNACI